MHTGFPCPNPTCTQVFSLEAIAGAAALTCPKCGGVFQFRSGPAAPSNYPAARPVAPPLPVAQPVMPPAAAFAPSTTAQDFALSDSAAGGIHVRPPRRGGGGGGAVLFLLLLLAAAGGGAYYLYATGFRFDVPLNPASQPIVAAPAATHKSIPFNYFFTFPTKEWKQDKTLERATRANIALRRGGPEGYLALFAKDYKTATPREADLIDLLALQMGQHLKNFEYEEKGATEWAGRKATLVAFQGQDDKGALLQGEACLMATQGYGYSLLLWAPVKDFASVMQEAPELRNCFTLLKGRDSWVDKPPQTETYKGGKADYTLRDGQGIWKSDAALKSFHKADLALQGTDRTDKSQAARASALVLLLPKAPDLAVAVSVARDNLEDQYKKDFADAVALTAKDDDGKPIDRAGPVGDTPGHVVKLNIRGKSLDRFVTLGVLHRPEHILVVQLDCAGDHRGAWEPDFDQLLASFRLKGKK